MSENPVLNLARHFFGAGEEVPVEDRRIYSRDDLVRVVIAQQWAVAIALHRGLGWCHYVGNLPCAYDVVTEMEHHDS